MHFLALLFGFGYFADFESKHCFLPGVEHESDINYTKQSTFRIHLTGFVPSHPGGGGVECRVKMADNRLTSFYHSFRLKQSECRIFLS